MPEREEEWIEGRSADDAEHEGAKEGEAVRALRPMGRVAREELHVLLSRVSERRHLKTAAAGESGGGRSTHTHEARRREPDGGGDQLKSKTYTRSIE